MKAAFTIILSIGVMFSVLAQKPQPALSQTQEFAIAKPAVYFTENKGQIHDGHYNPRPDVLAMGISPQQQLSITAKGISHQLKRLHWKTKEDKDSLFPPNKLMSEKEVEKTEFYRVDMHWIGANEKPEIEKNKELPGYINYYNVTYAEDGILEVRDYEEVMLKKIYPGIDVRYYGTGNSIEYDYLISPGADYKQIKIKITGTQAKLDKEGNLLLETPLGIIAESAPKVFQEGKELKSRWKQFGKNTWGFEIEAYKPELALLIDPVVRVWGTYYGGSEYDNGLSCAVDGIGNVYLAGFTSSANAIVTAGAHQATFGGDCDAFLVQFNSLGIRQWGTYYGGSGTDYGWFCAVDGSGNVYLAGWTYSDNAIATPGAHQATFGGKWDAFLVQFNSLGVRQWGTYYGGSEYDYGYSCVVDGIGNVYLAGDTYSPNAIATPGAHQVTLGGNRDAFLVKFNSLGVRQWGTYYGGIGDDWGYSCAVDGSGKVYLAGGTYSANAIATPGAHQDTLGGYYDAFLVQFNSLCVRQWGTYYGGSESAWGSSCAVDGSGNVYLAGNTYSDNAIATPGAHQATLGGDCDAFLAKFNSLGVRQWGTYYGGSGWDWDSSCAVDGSGNVYLAGVTYSDNFIATPGAHQATYGGYGDAFLVQFNSQGIRQWGTYYGGSGYDIGRSCAMDGIGNVYLAGYTNSANAIATIGAHQATFGVYDAFLVKFVDCPFTKELTEITCNSFTAPDGITYTNSGIYTTELPNHEACGNHSVLSLTIKLTILNSTQSNITQSACNTYTTPDGKTYTQSGKYTSIIPNAAGCDSIIEIDLSIHTAEVFVETKDTTILQGTSTPLKVSGGVSYSWYPNIGLSCSNCQNPLAAPAKTTTYYLMATAENGCFTRDSVTVFVDEDLHVYIPNIFSPNGDGQNDVLYVRGKGIKNVQFFIYNRWGEKVFESNNLSQGWDGSYKGEAAPIAVYVFMVDAMLESGQRVFKKGDVTLIR
ncbi:MAG: SBBP repeat-containing protein [Bacteroidetes bacterium]|nr:SBBP repeat-containing protein [Bacteroidota bacterium]HET6244900.1 SBBP repeat-containing protein [Bacteroidia bacterium]